MGINIGSILDVGGSVLAGGRNDDSAFIFWESDKPLSVTIDISPHPVLLGKPPAFAAIQYFDPSLNKTVVVNVPIGGGAPGRLTIPTGVPRGSIKSWGNIVVSIRNSGTPQKPPGGGVLGKLFNFFKPLSPSGKAVDLSNAIAAPGTYRVQLISNRNDEAEAAEENDLEQEEYNRLAKELFDEVRQRESERALDAAVNREIAAPYHGPEDAEPGINFPSPSIADRYRELAGSNSSSSSGEGESGSQSSAGGTGGTPNNPTDYESEAYSINGNGSYFNDLGGNSGSVGYDPTAQHRDLPDWAFGDDNDNGTDPTGGAGSGGTHGYDDGYIGVGGSTPSVGASASKGVSSRPSHSYDEVPGHHAADGGGGFGSSDYGDYWFPVLLDLDGDGVEYSPLLSSSTFFDIDGDGYFERTAWVAPDDGILAIDLADDGTAGADGAIDQLLEIGFSEWHQDAETDMEGLALVFDTDGDGFLSPTDTRWSEFRIWQDLNQNAVVDDDELKTLDEAGIIEIGLETTGNVTELPGGSTIHSRPHSSLRNLTPINFPAKTTLQKLAA